MFNSKSIGSIPWKASDALPLPRLEGKRWPTQGFSAYLRSPHLARSRRASYLITVDFEASDGQEFFTVGGGGTLEDAIGAAREVLPPGADWNVVRWNHVHGY
jgi:hypothetical protein